jgi:hypothetical protein
MYSKTHLLLEIIWLITGTLCILAAIRLVTINGYTNRILLFLAMALVSFLFAWFRHRQRKKK